MYACILETGRGFFEGSVRLGRLVSISQDPPPPCYSRMVLCQPSASGGSRCSADELSKMVLAISARGTWLKVERGWGKKGGESCRMLHLRFRNGVDGVVGVDQQPD